LKGKRKSDIARPDPIISLKRQLKIKRRRGEEK